MKKMLTYDQFANFTTISGIAEAGRRDTISLLWCHDHRTVGQLVTSVCIGSGMESTLAQAKGRSVSMTLLALKRWRHVRPDGIIFVLWNVFDPVDGTGPVTLLAYHSDRDLTFTPEALGEFAVWEKEVFGPLSVEAFWAQPRKPSLIDWEPVPYSFVISSGNE